MKYLMTTLILVLCASVSHAAFEDQTDYMTFKRELFGPKLPGGFYEITNPKAFDAHVAKAKAARYKDPDDAKFCDRPFRFENGRYTGDTEGSTGHWMQIEQITNCGEPDFFRPTLFVFTIPQSRKRFVVLGLTNRIEKVLVSDDWAAIRGLTVISTGYYSGGAQNVLAFHIVFDTTHQSRRLPTKLIELAIPAW